MRVIATKSSLSVVLFFCYIHRSFSLFFISTRHCQWLICTHFKMFIVHGLGYDHLFLTLLDHLLEF